MEACDFGVLTAALEAWGSFTACMRVKSTKDEIEPLPSPSPCIRPVPWRPNLTLLFFRDFSGVGDVCIPRSSYAANLLRNSGAYGDSIATRGHESTVGFDFLRRRINDDI
jgi:hypothetical protein